MSYPANAQDCVRFAVSLTETRGWTEMDWESKNEYLNTAP